MDRQVKQHPVTEQIMKLSEASVATTIICVLATRVHTYYFLCFLFTFLSFFLPTFNVV